MKSRTSSCDNINYLSVQSNNSDFNYEILIHENQKIFNDIKGYNKPAFNKSLSVSKLDKNQSEII